jgi:hypothetical protein
MKSKFLFPVILIVGSMLFGFSVFKLYSQATFIFPDNQQPAIYTCSMHPEVVQDKPGNCPKCGMNLIEKKASPKGSNPLMGDTAVMKPYPRRMMCDSTNMNKVHMMNDSTPMRHGQKGM